MAGIGDAQDAVRQSNNGTDRSSRRGASGRRMGQDSGSPSGWHQLLPRLRPPAESVERRLRDALCAEGDPVDELPGGRHDHPLLVHIRRPDH